MTGPADWVMDSGARRLILSDVYTRSGSDRSSEQA